MATTIYSRLPLVMPTEEEDNYLRIALLLTGISPRAVRQYFDEEFDPSCLERTIRHGRNTLMDLKTKRVINQSQLDLLLPRTGSPESKYFDVTLMITLLKNLASVPVPNDLPVATDISKGGALGTIKYYRNHLAHLHDSRIDTAQFNTIWIALEKAVHTLSGPILHDEVSKLRTKVLDRSSKEIMLCVQQSIEEINDLRKVVTGLTTDHESLKTQHQVLQQEHKELEKKFMDPVPANIREMIKSKLKRWKDEDAMFAVTSSSKAILKRCIKNLYVTITGNSGMGKTATLRHVALQMAANGYDVIPVHEPSEVKQYYNQEKKTVFVVDDFCGKYSADRIEIEKWEQFTENYLTYLKSTNVNVKIIVSCRLQVFQDELFDSLSFFKTCVCNLLSNHYKLSSDDLLSIAQVYFKRNADKVVQFAHDCFPLLCKLYSDNPSLGLDLFKHPFTVYETELNQMYKRKNYVSYCALALCVMFNNNVEEELLTEEIDPGLRLVFENTFEACKLNRGTSRLEIRDTLNILKDTFISKEGNVYKTIHDKIFDFLSFYFGTKMITFLIRNADIKWISERLLLDEYTCDIEPYFTVIVFSKDRSLLVDRLVNEWSNGQVYNVFLSINMKESKFREEFLCHIQSLDSSQQNVLAQKNDMSNKTNPLIFSAFYGDKRWISWCLYHGISVNMTDINRVSSLHAACQNTTQNTDIVQILLDNKAQINQCTTNDGATPLHLACQQGHTEIVQLLLENKADTNQSTSDNGTAPLHIACLQGHLDIVKILLDYNADINQGTTDKNITPLYLACQNGYSEIVKELIKHKANINKWSSDRGGTPLHIVCKTGNTEIVQILLENKADINKFTTDIGVTPLYIACEHGHKIIVKMLIDNKANINQRVTNNGTTPLYMACQNGHADIVKILLDEKADVNQCTTDIAISPLHIACQEGHVEIVQQLIVNKAEINQCTTNIGISPLHIACQEGHSEIVKKLIVNKADINQCTTYIGLTPLHLACQGGHAKTVQILLNNKADINLSTTDRDFSPLYLASMEGHTEIVKILLENLADINQYAVHRETPLSIACRMGHIQIVKMLIAYKANINQCCTDTGATPLYMACLGGHIEIVRILLDKKADINHRAKDQTPIYIACRKGYTEIVKMLLNNKADINLCTTNKGILPLYVACEQGHAKIKLLIDNKANINQRTKYICSTLLQVACQEGHTKIVQLLLDHKVDINLCTIFNETPFFIACQMGHTNIVKILIDNNADINLCSKRGGRSPLCAACHNGHIEVVKIILDNSGIIIPCLCSIFKRVYSL